MAEKINIKATIILAMLILLFWLSSLAFVANKHSPSHINLSRLTDISTTAHQSYEKLLPIKQNGKWGYINKNSDVVIQPQYDDALDFVGEIAPVKINNKWGYIDRTGRVVLHPRSYNIWLFYDGLARSSPTPTTWKYINQRGETVIRLKADFAKVFSEGFAAIQRGRFWGYIDTSGKLVVRPQFIAAEDFSGGLAAVKKGRLWGYIDRTGKLTVEPQFIAAENFSEGAAFVKTTSEAGFINSRGEMIVKCSCDWAKQFSEGLAAVSIGGKIGFIDNKGELIISPQFTAHTEGDIEGEWLFSNNRALVRIGDKFGSPGIPVVLASLPLSRSSNSLKILGRCFSVVSLPREFRESHKFNYIDRQGRIISQTMFDEGRKFSDGLASITLHGKEGYIDTTGKIVIEPQFTAAYDFSDGIALVNVEDKWGYISKTGSYIWPLSE